MILTTNIENLLGEANTSKTKAKYTSFPKKVTGPSNNNDSVQAVYEVSEHKYKYGKNTITTPTAAQQIKFDEDKKEIKWAFRIDNSLMNNKKEYIIISERSLMTESDNDFTQETNRNLFKDAVAEKGYLQATIDPITRKLTITFSKWLDGMKVYVEAFRNNPDSKIKAPLQTYIKETNIKATFDGAFTPGQNNIPKIEGTIAKEISFLTNLYALYSLQKQLNNIPPVFDVITIFFGEMTCINATGGEINGFSFTGGGVSMMNVQNPTTKLSRDLSHEALHAIDLHHSFDNTATHYFKKGRTDNIMDYDNTPKNTWKWQWDDLYNSQYAKNI